MTVLLPTKFYVPQLPAGFVARPQLLQQLDAALCHRLTLVSAPAGAGKTTLVSAWVPLARQKGAVVGWLALDEDDNDPDRFLEYLVAGLEEGGMVLDAPAPVGEGGPAPVLLGPAPALLGPAPVMSGLVGFIRGAAALRGELVLILDDYHRIENKQVHAALEMLLEHAPPGLHLVLLTRSDPPLPLARLRVAGQLAELRMEQLRFSQAEAAAFLRKTAGVPLSPSDVAALTERTEGWIAGLQMAAISLRGRADAPAFVAAFTGSHRYVFDYLLEQVLNRQPQPVREFLLLTSLLELFCAPLCDALTGAEGTARGLLDQLERDNLFLVPLDDERGWYRYHHLFAGLLQQVLEQTHPGLAPELHRRAAAWHAAHGSLSEALHHALRAGDARLAAGLVSENVLALIDHAELAPILPQMDTLLRDAGAQQPWLRIAHAWGLAYSGRMERAEDECVQAQAQAAQLPPGEQSRLLGHIAAVRGYAAWVLGRREQAVEAAQRAEELLPREETAVRALNLTTLGNAMAQYGLDPRAAEVLDQAVSLARQAGQSHVLMLAATALAYIYIVMGRYRQAQIVCQEVVEAAEGYLQSYGRPLPAAASAYSFLGRIYQEWNELERSLECHRKSAALADLWGQADTIVLCQMNLAETLARAGDKAGAFQAVRRARLAAQKVSPWFVLTVDETELSVCVQAGELARAGQLAAQLSEQLIAADVLAQLLLHQNRLAELLDFINRHLPEISVIRPRDKLRLLVYRALALHRLRNEAGALTALEQALTQSEPEGFTALYLEQGPEMEKLLRLVQARPTARQAALRLLEAFAQQAKPQPPPTAAAQALIEPLSERELEVLRLLNGPLSTPEIAAQLVVSANTVRTHIKNIYAKLAVHGRSGAVRRAKELGLIG